MNCIREDLKLFNNNPFLSASFLELLDNVEKILKNLEIYITDKNIILIVFMMFYLIIKN